MEDKGERVALHRLLLHCAQYARIGGSLVWQLARYHRDWLHPVEEWISRSQNAKEQLTELTQFLLGREEIPLSDNSRLQPGAESSVGDRQINPQDEDRPVVAVPRCVANGWLADTG